MRLGTAIFWIVASAGVAMLALGVSDRQGDKVPATAKVVAADFIPIGAKVITTGRWVACREQADLDRAKDLARQDDAAAATAYAASHGCRVVKSGATGVAEDISVWHGSTCLRQPSEPDCYWFPTEFVRKAD